MKACDVLIWGESDMTDEITRGHFLRLLGAGVGALGALFAGQSARAASAAPDFFDGLDDESHPMMDEARRRIETIRKGNFTVRFVKPAGSPASGKASIRLANHEFGFGANLTSVMLLKEDNPMRARGLDAIADLFNMVRIGDNWGLMEPVRGGPLHWGAADRDLAWAKSHGMTCRHHALMYVFKNMPAWSQEIHSPEEWWPLIERRIQAVAERHGDSVREFEAIKEDWSSRWDGDLSPHGAASFRGFFGKYEANVEGHGAAQFSLGSAGPREVVVRLTKR